MQSLADRRLDHAVLHSAEERSIIRAALRGFDFRYCVPLDAGFVYNSSLRSFGGSMLFVRKRSLNGAKASQKQSARDLGLRKMGNACIIGPDRPELLGKARKIQHLLSFTFLPVEIPPGRFKLTSRGNGVTIRYENFSDLAGPGESVIVDTDEYLRVESHGDHIGAVWTSNLTAGLALEALIKVLGDSPSGELGHIVVEEIDGSLWEADGSTEDIRGFSIDEPDRVVSATIQTGSARLRWTRPALRIKTAVTKTAELGLLAERRVFTDFVRVLGATATPSIHSNPAVIALRVKQLLLK